MPLLQIHRTRILPHSQIRPAFDILNHQSLLVGQVQQANKPKRSADVGQLLPRVHVLQVVHNGREGERALVIFRQHRDLGAGGCLEWVTAADVSLV